MKQLSFVLLVIACAMSFVACATEKRLHAYRAYYRATETLLDSLENHFNWVDKYDPGEALDNYNQCVKQLNR